MRTITRVLLLGLILFCAAAWKLPAAEASPGGGQGPGQGIGGGPPDGPPCADCNDEQREKLRQRAEAMMIFLLADEMELSADKEDKFMAIMRNHFKERHGLIEKERKYQQEIEKELDSAKGGADLKKKLAELDALREKQQASEKQFRGKLKGVLSIEEQAKFVVALPRVQRELMARFEKHKGKMNQQKGLDGEEKSDAKKPLKGKFKGKN